MYCKSDIRCPEVELTDPAGYTFPVATDSACRNRLLHSRPLEGSEFLPALWSAGIRAYRAVFMLRAVEEYTVEETARILGIPEATVRSRLFRAKSLLREGLASEVDLATEDVFAFAGERCDRIVSTVMKRISN